MLTTLADTFRIATFQNRAADTKRHCVDPAEEIRKLRFEVRHLDDRLLRDIGLDPNDFDADECPPVWRWLPR